MSEALTLFVVYVVAYAFALVLIFFCVRYDDERQHKLKNKYVPLDDESETTQEAEEMENLNDKINEMAFYLESANDEMDKIANELIELGVDEEKILKMIGLGIGASAIVALSEGKNALDLYEDFAYLIFKGADENDEE